MKNSMKFCKVQKQTNTHIHAHRYTHIHAYEWFLILKRNVFSCTVNCQNSTILSIVGNHLINKLDSKYSLKNKFFMLFNKSLSETTCH